MQCDTVADGTEGGFLTWDTSTSGVREPCQRVLHAVGGPAGARLQLQVEGLDGYILEQRDWNGTLLASRPAEAGVEFVVPFAGEHLLVLVPGEEDRGGAYALEARCVEGCETAWSRHPVLLMHGMGAIIPNRGGFYEVEETLAHHGYVAYQQRVDPYQAASVRARQWREHLDAWRANGTWRRVHLWGHSMGGIDARYVATHLDPDHQVVSVSTYGSPHRGSPIADAVLHVMDHSETADTVLIGLADWLGPLNDGATDNQDLYGQLLNLSPAGMELFNAEVPNRSDVVYRSWAGVTCSWLDFDCQETWNGELVDWELAAPLLYMNSLGEPSDGVVTVDSATWGEFQGILAADHYDLHGQANTGVSFDHYAFFLEEAARMVDYEESLSTP